MSESNSGNSAAASTASILAGQPPIPRLLLTGAAGGLGKALRTRLAPITQVLRLSDIAPVAPAAGEHEEFVACDLVDKAAVERMVADCQAIVHMGGISVEHPFDVVMPANIQGMFNLYEAARRQRVARVVFASSNHVIGFYKQTQRIGTDVLPRPDGYYGLSKAFGENLAQFYFDRYGIETVSIRIGSAFPEPINRRMLSTWISYDDLAQLIVRALFTKDVGHLVVYGASANREVWWDNSGAARLGFQPHDSSEAFRAKIEAQPPVAADDPDAVYQGGAFTARGPYGD